MEKKENGIGILFLKKGKGESRRNERNKGERARSKYQYMETDRNDQRRNGSTGLMALNL